VIEVPGQFYEVKVSFLDDLPPDLLRKVGPCPPDLPRGAEAVGKVEMNPWPAVDLKFVNVHLLVPLLLHLLSRPMSPLTTTEAASVLVFLPGKDSIAAARWWLNRNHVLRYQVEVFELHGEQEPMQQNLAVDGWTRTRGKLKVILATNVAESSLTIRGVKVVIDAGLVKLMCNEWLQTKWTGRQNIN
jgi:HrpA-like RNA helicase